MAYAPYPEWNGRFPTVEALKPLGLDACWRQEAIRILRSMDGGSEAVEEVLERAAECMSGAYGVESVRGSGAPWMAFYMDTRALYVNRGDTYRRTLLFDVARGAFYVTSWGDWVETAERTRRYKFD